MSFMLFLSFSNIFSFILSLKASLFSTYPSSSPEILTLYIGLYLIKTIAIIKPKAIIVMLKYLKISFV